MSTAKARRPRFRLNDWVKFNYGLWPVHAQIVEDRGPLGAGRRRLYRIRFDTEFDEPISFEMPEDEMEKAVPDKAAILWYLKQGGLLEMLRTNLQFGPNQQPPKVWLTFTTNGEISHTASAWRGFMKSGAIVPSWAIHEGGLLPHKKPEVRTFLQDLGLTGDEAEEVMEAVGTGDPGERRLVTSRIGSRPGPGPAAPARRSRRGRPSGG